MLAQKIDGRFVRHFLAIFLPLALLVGLATYLVAREQIDNAIGQLEVGEAASVELGGDAILRGLRKVPAHARSLQQEAAIRQTLDDPAPSNLDLMAGAFTTLLQRNPEYEQAIWLDAGGTERVRVERRADGVAAVTEAELKDARDSLHFTRSVGLPLDQVFVSRFDLDIDNGRIRSPLRPTLRFAVPVADSRGVRQGVLVITYNGRSLLDEFVEVDRVGRPGRHLSLVDAEGFWLSSPVPEDEWGFMFGKPTTLGARAPEIWRAVNAGQNGQQLGADGLWSWKSISLGQKSGPLENIVGPIWIVLSHVDPADLQAIYDGVWRPAGTIGVVAISILALLSWALARRGRSERLALERRFQAEAESAAQAARIAALEQSHVAAARLAAIVDSSHDAIIGNDLDGVITSWNKGAEALFGYAAEEVVGRNIAIVIPSDLMQEEEDVVRRIRAGEVVDHLTTLRRRKDGQLIDVSATISPVRDVGGVVIGASQIARDVTEARKIQAEIEAHRERLEQLVQQRTVEISETADRLRQRESLITAVTDAIPGVVGYWNDERRCQFANSGFVEWFGVDRNEIAGRTIDSTFDKRSELWDPAVVDAVLAGELQHRICEVHRPDGEVGYLSAHYVPDRKDGAVIGFFVLAIDITRQRDAEDGLRLLNSRLTDALASAEQASAAKGQFLANMSHEIRTPMNGVIAMLELLGHTGLDAEQRRMVGTINSSAQSLLAIINDILDFSKVEAGQLRIELVEADVGEIVESTARLFLGAAATKGISLRCFSAPQLPGLLLTDPVRLRQILSNLVSNAVKFTARGVVTITADLERGEDGADMIRIAVTDTGIGISPASQARLFQPFTQADDSTARRFGGTGLGLSISMRLAELLQGRIDLKSIEGEGTQVGLVLPARSARTAQADARDIDLASVNVGILAEDPIERDRLSAYLTFWGATVTHLAPGAVETTRRWLCRASPIVLAPTSLAAAARAQVAAARIGLAGDPPRFVFYCHDDLPADQTLAGDAITTTALSRARIITAVAVAAGQKSPEIETAHSLPSSDGAVRPPSREEALAAGRLILLAEDHPVNREVISRQLRFLGYAVDAVEDGAQALKALAETRYGLLLTDCNMPVMDGFALVRTIRRGEADGARLPIVALTANALEGEDRKCIAAGMDSYLSKPVGLDRLRDEIERFMPTAGGHEPSAAESVAEPASAEPAEPLTIPGDRQVFDLSTLEELCGAAPEARDEILSMYMESLHSDWANLQSSVASRDSTAVQLGSHSMKGAARIVGAERLAACCQIIEQAAHAADWAQIDLAMPLTAGVVGEMDRFRALPALAG